MEYFEADKEWIKVTEQRQDGDNIVAVISHSDANVPDAKPKHFTVGIKNTLTTETLSVNYLDPDTAQRLFQQGTPAIRGYQHPHR